MWAPYTFSIVFVNRLLSSDLERDGGQKTSKNALNLYLFYEIRTWTKGNVPQECLVFDFANLQEKSNSRKC
jgi:hypothetical protein